MFKKTLLVAALAAVSCGAMADGFYAGASVGAQGMQDKVTTFAGNKKNEAAQGAVGGVFGGYTFNFANQFNLGGEAFVNALSAKVNDPSITTTSLASSSYQVKSRYEYGVRAVPGYQVTADTDLHLLVGYVRGNFKWTDSAANGTNATNNLNGFQAGAGAGVRVMKNLKVRGDFYYTGYQSKTVDISNKISALTGIASLAYDFG